MFYSFICYAQKVTKKQQQEFLKEKLSTSKVWALNALVKIYENQTEDEQNSEHTIEANGIGFSGLDGNILSSFATQYKKRGTFDEAWA